jgi:hypothetical protein
MLAIGSIDLENKMSPLNQNQSTETAASEWQSLCKIGGAAALIQLACLLMTIIVASTVGIEPKTAADYFTVLQNDRLVGFLRLDFPTLILISLFPLTTFGVYAALRRGHQAYAALATALIFVGTILALVNHSAFSMIHLSNLHALATTDAQKAQLLIAGEAVIASDMWHSTAGFLAGIFMQGGFVIISLVMLRGQEFSKGTAYTGLLSNGLDLIHVFVALLAPSIATILLSIGGLFYLVWFPLLGRDLLKLGRNVSQEPQ